MGNEHVTDKQLKNSVFMAFGVIEAIKGHLKEIKRHLKEIKRHLLAIKRYLFEIVQVNIAKQRNPPETACFRGFLMFWLSFPLVLRD